MNVIAPRTLRAFWEKHPHAETPLQDWLKLMRGGSFTNFSELREVFPSADYVAGQFTIFNLGGNKYRLVTFNLYPLHLYPLHLANRVHQARDDARRVRQMERPKEAIMIAARQNIVSAWEAFHAATGGIKRPATEEEYTALHALAEDLTSRYNCNEEPYASLFDLIATYMHEWELEFEPELKNPDVPPHRVLAFLMEQQGVSQYQLAKEGIVDQGNLSKILKGEREISKELAKKLVARFKVSAELFL